MLVSRRCLFLEAFVRQDEDFEVKASMASVFSLCRRWVRRGWWHSLLAGGALRGAVPKVTAGELHIIIIVYHEVL